MKNVGWKVKGLQLRARAFRRICRISAHWRGVANTASMQAFPTMPCKDFRFDADRTIRGPAPAVGVMGIGGQRGLGLFWKAHRSSGSQSLAIGLPPEFNEEQAFEAFTRNHQCRGSSVIFRFVCNQRCRMGKPAEIRFDPGWRSVARFVWECPQAARGRRTASWNFAR